MSKIKYRVVESLNNLSERQFTPQYKEGWFTGWKNFAVQTDVVSLQGPVQFPNGSQAIGFVKDQIQIYWESKARNQVQIVSIVSVTRSTDQFLMEKQR